VCPTGRRSAPSPLASSDFFKSSSSDSCLTSRSIFGGGEALCLCLEFGFLGASLFGDTIDVESAEHAYHLGNWGWDKQYLFGSVLGAARPTVRRLRERIQAWLCCWTIPYVIEDLVVLPILVSLFVCLPVCVLSNMCTIRSGHAPISLLSA
jgi:hypothetical protein